MDRVPEPRISVAPQSALPVLALVALVVGNLTLAFGPLLVRLADVGPVASAFWRMGLAGPVLFALAVAMGSRPVAGARGLWIVIALGGIAFAADLASWHLGIVRTTAANATLFGNSAILIFVVYGFLAARSWPSRPEAVALLLALAGGALLLGRSAKLSARNLAGDLLCLLAGVFYAIYFIQMARVRERVAALPALALSTLVSALPLLAAALLIEERVLPADWTPLLLLALSSQVVGQGCMIYALGHLPPLVIGIALLIQPAVAAMTGWVAFGERLGAADLVGAALVAAALVLVRAGQPAANALADEAGTARSRGKESEDADRSR